MIAIKILTFVGGKKARGRGAGGKGVRGVDFGLGIGYNPESNNKSSSTAAVSSHSSVVNPLRSGTGMAQFKSKFVAASSNSQNQGVNKKMLLPGFVSGGTIGGDTRPAQGASSTNAGGIPTGNISALNVRDNTNQRNLDR